ncbi:uncharacterized protein LOC111636479 [Centruroides sculpturatus]|uniref:uncharacterized protein LOC111636479 n=1 Tax=Centruroides sculpturatus TaxID=218467 RepID=UPI000C6E61F9|nr:uncharacterized protein LOC111636479 [Centruroides sculpturatus]
MIEIIFLLFVCQNVLADITVEEGNAYVDSFIKSAVENEELEMLVLPDHDIPIVRKVLFIRTEILLREGQIYGLSHISRYDDVQIDEGNRTLITCNLDLKDLEVRYKVRFIFLNSEQKPINITGLMNNNKVILKLLVNKENREVSVDSLYMSKLSGFRVILKDIGSIFKWLANAFNSVVINILKKDITSLVQDHLREAFEKEAERRNDMF